MKDGNTRKKSITFSLDNIVLNQIKEDAKTQGLSTSAKMMQVLEKYDSFYKPSGKLEYSIIPGRLWSSMVDLMPEENLLEILHANVTDTLYPMFDHKNTKPNLDYLITNYFQEIAIWSGLYSTFHFHKERKEYDLIFEHKYGIKWSRVLASTFAEMMETNLKCLTQSHALPNIVKIKISGKRLQ